MKEAATKSYGKKGEKVVAMNHAAIDRGINGFSKVTVPAAWKTAVDEAVEKEVLAETPVLKEYEEKILTPVNAQRGDKLPVSTFVDSADGTFPLGSSALEKRGIAVNVPKWIPENCIQCNFCSYVCPHAVIRPVAMTEDEAKKDVYKRQRLYRQRRCPLPEAGEPTAPPMTTETTPPWEFRQAE